MRLELATWMEVERYVERCTGVIVPIGSTEQHGPTGLLGTDAMTAETIAHAIGKKCDVLVTPTIAFGMAQHHLAFAGTVSLRPSTLMAVVCDVVASLARHGFDRIFFLNGHGGNVETVNASFSEIFADTSFDREPRKRVVRCVIRSWYEAQGVQELCDQLYGASNGDHGTASEIAVTQFRYPDHIKKIALDPVVAPGFEDGVFDALDLRARYPDGRIGSNPALATPEHGKLLVETAVESLARDFLAFVDSGRS